MILKLNCLPFILIVGQVFAYFDENQQLYVRKDCNDLTQKEWESFRRGVAVMKSRHPLDPTSWIYQANIHGWSGQNIYPEENAKLHWSQCQHGQWFFLPWHRLYIYFFEKILREASGDPELTVCYWDYYRPEHSSLPIGFRNPITRNGTFNSLYDGTRCHSLNKGTGHIPRRLTDPTATLNIKRFAHPNETPIEKITQSIHSFGGDIDYPAFGHTGFGSIENLPHNQVHLYVGGHMGDLCHAALDPIFWAHHVQIDRLWITWMKLGNKVPTNDQTWMNQEFTFFDVHGQEIKIKVKHVIDSEDNLGYTYESLPKVPAKKVPDNTFTSTSTITGKYNRHICIGGLNEAIITANKETIAVPLNKDGRKILKNIYNGNIRTGEFKISLTLNFTVRGERTIYDVFIQHPENVDKKNARFYYIQSVSSLVCADDPKSLIPISTYFDATENFNYFSSQHDHLIGDSLALHFVSVRCDDSLKPAELHLKDLKFYFSGVIVPEKGDHKHLAGWEHKHLPDSEQEHLPNTWYGHLNDFGHKHLADLEHKKVENGFQDKIHVLRNEYCC